MTSDMSTSPEPEPSSPPFEASKPPVYSDEQMVAMINSQFEKDLLLDAALDVFIFKAFTTLYPDHRKSSRQSWGYGPPALHYDDSALIATYQQELVETLRHAGQTSAESFDTMMADKDGPSIFDRLKIRYSHLYESCDLGNIRSVAPSVSHPLDFTDAANTIVLSSNQQPQTPGDIWLEKKKRGSDNSVEEEPADRALSRLKELLDGEKAAATFTCGGEVAGSVRIFFGGNRPSQIDFPGGSEPSMRALLEMCEPASFGYQGKDVLDPSYRQALKLSPDSFASNFHPYDAGMIEVIQQTLLPTVLGRNESVAGRRYISAELYTLNIYAGPSGMFKAHVDTPRSEKQFGSLVVCLPHPHEGGDLAVRHNGMEMVYRWGDESPAGIKWAAFYSDCEHEVLPVTAGYRVTLTYNLYLGDRAADTIPPSPDWDVTKTPLHSTLANLLEDPAFLPNGGVLGFYCDHAYAHTAPTVAPRLPDILKGVDAALLVALQKLGIRAVARPLYSTTPENYWNYPSPPMRLQDFQRSGVGYEPYWMRDGRKREPKEELSLGYYDQDAGYLRRPELQSVAARCAGLRARRTVVGIGKPWEEIVVGDGWKGFEGTDNSSEELGELGVLESRFEVSRLLDGVAWINEPKECKGDAALAYLAYGNNASVEMVYSHAVILATVPSYNARRG